MSTQSILNEWEFTRKLSQDFLKSLSSEQLEYTPEVKMGPLWKQFRHLARVQQNYTDALLNLKVDFSTRGSNYQGGSAKDSLG